MSDQVPHEGIIKSLKSIVTIEITILLLSFVCAANIFLNRGCQLRATTATLAEIQSHVKPATGILFLCAFGLFMNAGIGLIHWALWKAGSWKLLPSQENPGINVHWALDVLKAANREQNDYLLRAYKEHRDENRELASLSRLAQSCIVLIATDGILSWKYSIIFVSWSAIASTFGNTCALIIVLTILVFLGSLAGQSFFQKNPDHIHLPGLKNKVEIEREMRPISPPPPSGPLESVPPLDVQPPSVHHYTGNSSLYVPPPSDYQ